MSLADKHVVVTGAEGFIGSHVCEMLVQAGARVRALVWYNAFGHYGWLDAVPAERRNSIEIVLGDVRDAHAMHGLLADTSIVFHLPSLIGIPYSYHAPDSYVDTNIRGTVNLLQAARAVGVERFVHTSTSEVYGTARRVPIDETHPQVGQSPYSASKIAADQLAVSFHRSFDLPVVIARPFNTYGPRQSARAVIPTIITQLLDGDGTVKLGATAPTRDFTYVTDTAAGLVAAATADNVLGETINIGSGDDIGIGELAELIGRLMNREIRIVNDPDRTRPAASEVDRLVCDVSRARNLLDWSPRKTLSDGLTETIAWFSRPENLKRYRPGWYGI